MFKKKMNNKTRVWLVIALFVLSLCIWSVMFNKNANPKNTNIPFTYTQAGDLEPERLTKEITQAIGYPNAVPIVTEEDRFFAVLYSHPNQQDMDKRILTLASTFRISVPEKDRMRIFTYQIQASQAAQSGLLDIIYRDEIQYAERPDEQSHLSSGVTLTDLLGAIRDFPAVSYRELTEYGNESADLYQIRFNNGLLNGESFSYNMYGPVQNDSNRNGIPFVISNLKWGNIRDDSLDENDPHRYFGFGGKDGVNLYYYP